MEQVQTSLNHILSSSSSSSSSSPEFEFSYFPQPHLRSADQLFSDGFILPLHLLRLSPQPDPEPPSTSTSTFINTRKSWRYIFKKNYKNNSDSTAPDVGVVKETKKREKNNGAFVGVGAAELNINIWPFSRSRSAGNGGTRLRSTSATRRVSSAPCSRSSSAGESKTRKWPNSPIRGGVHLGRSSPVWQVRRNGAGRSGDAFVRKIPAAKARVLSLNVPTCIGYRNNLSCGNHQNSQVSVNAAAAGSVEGVRTSNFFNIRTLFSKKYH